MTITDKIKKAIEKGEELVEESIEKVEEVAKEVIEKSEEIIKDSVEKVEEVAKEIIEKGEEVIGIKKKSKSKDFEKAAEAESTKTEKSLEEKKKALLEKVAKLQSKVDESKSTEELKEQVKIKKRTDMLIPLDEYVKAGIYLGTKVVTPDMKPFVYRRRADGLAIFNTDLIDEKLKEGIEYMAKFEAEDIVLACKRQAGWQAAKMFSKITGIRTFTKKYPAGILTNTNLEDFFENELTIVTDSWLDKNALKDTKDVKKKVLMISDTNNFSKKADKVIIGNNKSEKSLGVIFYILTKGFCKAKNIDAKIPDLEWWTGELDE